MFSYIISIWQIKIQRKITVKSPKIGEKYYFNFAGSTLFGILLKESKSLSKHYNEKWYTMELDGTKYPISIREIALTRKELKMYSSSELKGMLFIDIETCTQYKDLSDLEKNGPDGLSELWAKKADSIRLYEEDKRELSNTELYKNASMFPEFGKINTISIGQISFDEIGMPVSSKIKSFMEKMSIFF